MSTPSTGEQVGAPQGRKVLAVLKVILRGREDSVCDCSPHCLLMAGVSQGSQSVEEHGLVMAEEMGAWSPCSTHIC